MKGLQLEGAKLLSLAVFAAVGKKWKTSISLALRALMLLHQ
jgi:hypothetical protein